MHAAIKVIVGLILVVIGLGLLANGVLFEVSSVGTFWLKNFIVTLTGIIPPFLILIGLFVVWLELDEIKAEKELKAEESKEKEKKK
jgi:cadmium resistance protein CadD (predicted permease)